MTETAERKYALTKITASDYLLPSNDAQTLWRIATYREDTGIVWWGLWRWKGDSLGSDTLSATPIDPDDWDRWEMVDSMLETRREAIREAMRTEPMTGEELLDKIHRPNAPGPGLKQR